MLRLTKLISSFSIGFILILTLNSRVHENTESTDSVQEEPFSFNQEYFIDKIDIPFDGVHFNIKHSHYNSILKFAEPRLRPNECMMLFASLVRTQKGLVGKVSFIKRRLPADNNAQMQVIKTQRAPLCTLCNLIHRFNTETVSKALYINGAFINHFNELKDPDASIQLVSEPSLEAQ